MRTKKRTLVTTKVYGFNPWMDQLLTINQIMETTGQKSEAPIIRDLIDEALTARRRKTSAAESEAPGQSAKELTDSLQTIQALLVKLIEQGQTDRRVPNLSLELLQEVLVEAHASRIAVWETVAVPKLAIQGIEPSQIANRFEGYTAQAQGFAYVLAEQIRDEVIASETAANIVTEDDDRQGSLHYEEPRADEDQGD